MLPTAAAAAAATASAAATPTDVGAPAHVVAGVVVAHALDHEGHHVCRGGEGLILDLGLKRGTHLPISGQLCHQHTKVIAGLNSPQIRSHPAAADRRVPNEVLPLFKPRHPDTSPHIEMLFSPRAR